MADAKEDKKEKKPLNLLFVGQLVFSILNLTLVATGAFLVYKSTLGWHSPSITEQELVNEKESYEEDISKLSGPLVYTMEKFTVNLDGQPKRILRMEVNLEMLGKEGFEEIINSDNQARAHDLIVRLLGEKTFSEIETIQGKLFLKDKITTAINHILEKGVVKDVYFTEFVVQ